jgi:hypothetical protein
MNGNSVYIPSMIDLTCRCARLRAAMRNAGRDVAAFFVPERTLRRIETEVGHELREFTLFGRPVYEHSGDYGVIAEKGLRLGAPRYTLEWRR